LDKAMEKLRTERDAASERALKDRHAAAAADAREREVRVVAAAAAAEGDELRRRVEDAAGRMAAYDREATAGRCRSTSC
jgi:Tfp pilus assembly PilM family ATPase